MVCEGRLPLVAIASTNPRPPSPLYPAPHHTTAPDPTALPPPYDPTPSLPSTFDALTLLNDGIGAARAAWSGPHTSAIISRLAASINELEGCVGLEVEPAQPRPMCRLSPPRDEPSRPCHGQ